VTDLVARPKDQTVTGPVVAVLGRGIVPADTPVLRADDLGVLRGDGIFETLHVRGGQPWLLEEHLSRMAASARRLELHLPGRDALASLAALVSAAWPAAEGALRLVCTRGSERGGPVTVFAVVGAVSEEIRRGRRDGLAVRTATLGLSTSVRQEAPWLLGGAKSLSYAVNMASQRWVRRAGADDMLWISTDGYALEAPTSTLIWLDGATLCTVPVDRTGVLPGTTARWLFDHAGDIGLDTAERMVRPAGLRGSDGAWLTSSVRGCAPVRELDGAHLPASPHTAAIQELLGYPV
jgi:4-amino-4-deoxychorismate lyase